MVIFTTQSGLLVFRDRGHLKTVFLWLDALGTLTLLLEISRFLRPSFDQPMYADQPLDGRSGICQAPFARAVRGADFGNGLSCLVWPGPSIKFHVRAGEYICLGGGPGVWMARRSRRILPRLAGFLGSPFTFGWRVDPGRFCHGRLPLAALHWWQPVPNGLSRSVRPGSFINFHVHAGS